MATRCHRIMSPLHFSGMAWRYHPISWPTKQNCTCCWASYWSWGNWQTETTAKHCLPICLCGELMLYFRLCPTQVGQLFCTSKGRMRDFTGCRLNNLSFSELSQKSKPDTYTVHPIWTQLWLTDLPFMTFRFQLVCLDYCRIAHFLKQNPDACRISNRILQTYTTCLILQMNQNAAQNGHHEAPI